MHLIEIKNKSRKFLDNLNHFNQPPRNINHKYLPKQK